MAALGSHRNRTRFGMMGVQRPLGTVLGAVAAAAALAAILGAAAAPLRDGRVLYSADGLAAIYRRSPLEEPPPDPTDRVADSASAAALGQFLFFDRGLSANGEIACASCHQPARGFSDGRALAKGLAGGRRNTPTLLNVAFNHWFFWDGRADSLWSQALQPLEGRREEGGDRLLYHPPRRRRRGARRGLSTGLRAAAAARRLRALSRACAPRPRSAIADRPRLAGDGAG